MFVIPIAIAFDPEYGLNAKGHPMVFNTQGKGINGTTTINLSKAAYCGIFNGTITNWNDPLLTKLNKKIPLVDPINDTFTAATAKTAASGRWATDGVPIRLVGRLDGAGTTDVFTRHLASVCNTTNGYTGPNYYLQHANFLPYNASSNGGVDFSTIRSDSNYKPGAAASNFAGTTNLVSGDYWNGSAIANIAAGTPTAAPVGSVGSGLYIVANGNGALAKLLVYPADYTLNGVKLNGKIGYVSADFIQPSVDAPGGLQAAALQVGTGATFALPTVKAALNGFTQLPPESDTLGAYLPGSDTRQVTAITGSTKVAATRTNPLAWAGVLYADPANTLADPQVAGSYPITGTDAFFGYTCYTTNNRLALVNTLGLTLGQINKNSANITISKAIFGGTVPANPGIDVQSNIGIVPKSWTNAIAQTFLKKGDAGAAGLYIQDALVATAAKGDPAKPKTYKPQVDPQPNPICSGITGA